MQKLNCHGDKVLIFGDNNIDLNSDKNVVKSNLHYTRRITPKRVTSCGAHFRGLAPGQHSSEEMLQRWRVVLTLCRFDRPGNRTPDLPHR